MSVISKHEKLLDWAIIALSQNDFDSATLLFQQYADLVRHTNPELASFYDNFLHQRQTDADAPEIARLNIGELDRQALPAIDRLLVSAVDLLTQGKMSSFTEAMMTVVALYAKYLVLKIQKIRGENRALNLNELLDAADVTEKLLYCFGRLRVAAERPSPSDR